MWIKLLQAYWAAPACPKPAKDLEVVAPAADRMNPPQSQSHFLATTEVATAGRVPLVLVAEDLGSINAPERIASGFQEGCSGVPTRRRAGVQIFAEYGGRLKALMKMHPRKNRTDGRTSFFKPERKVRRQGTPPLIWTRHRERFERGGHGSEPARF